MLDLKTMMPLTPLECILKICYHLKPEIGDMIPTPEELTEYLQWMAKDFGDNPKFKVSADKIIDRSFNLADTKISGLGERLVKNPHDYQAFHELRDMVQLYREESFISESSNISAGQMLRYFPSHWHSNDCFEVYYALSGECPIHFTNEVVTLQPGGVLIVAPSVVHASPCFGDDKILMSYMLRASVFNQVFWKLVPSQNLLSSFFHRALSEQLPNAYLQFETGRDEDIHHLLLSIYEEFMNQEAYQAEMLNSLLSAFFVLLLRRYEGTARLPRSEGFYWSRSYTGVLSHIQSHYNTVDLSELSTLFHYSDKQLRRIIQSTTGLSFQQLITKLRMEKAVELLPRFEMSIAEVSSAVGYATVSSFYRRFIEYYGCPPGEYLKTQVFTSAVADKKP